MEKLGTAISGLDLLSQASRGKQTGSPDLCKIHGVEKRFIPSRCDDLCPECWKIERNEELRKEKVADAHYFLSLPKRLKGMSFDNYRPANSKAAEALEICKKFAADMKGGLILIGSVGTGKTHLAVAICNAFCDAGKRAKLVTIPEIIRAVRSTWGNRAEYSNGETEEDVIEKYSVIPLLVIDEIGSQYGTDGERIIISEIINNRYNNELPTVLIGNVTMTQATEYLGERVIDRVRHGGRVVVFDWESYRKPA